MPSTNLKKIYTSPYRSYNFQQLFLYGIFFAQRVFYELSVVKVAIRQSTDLAQWVKWVPGYIPRPTLVQMA